MHISIVVLILIWLYDLPTSSAAPANPKANLSFLQVHRHTELSSDLQPNAAEIVDYLIPGTA